MPALADGGSSSDSSATSDRGPPFSLELLAGDTGGPGNVDGTGSAARFYSPSGVAVDSAGNVYVADMNNHTIRKVSSGEVVTTLAGTAGMSGETDEAGAAAGFRSPSGVTVDGTGNVYVADKNNGTIRKISAAGVVTTLAGEARFFGSRDGTGVGARFSDPTGVGVDSAGNVYVADTGNSTIRKVTPAGVVTTLAGVANLSGSADGTGTEARFNHPTGVAVDGAGNVYVADQNNHTIRKITSAAVVTTEAGSAGVSGYVDGPGAAARFAQPSSVAVDSAGNVYVADQNNHTIRKITPAGVVTIPAGTQGMSGSADGTGATARFNLPTRVTVDGAGNVYVADENNHAIRRITAAGVTTTLAGATVVSGGADGTGAAARFNSPVSVAVDSAGTCYVADKNNHTIRRVSSAGLVTTLAGTAGESGSADGIGTAARFNFPTGVAVDSAGNLYVADTDNHTIRKVTPAGVVTTLAGSRGMPGRADSAGTAAHFNFPTGLAVDSAGNVYVADTDNHTIRKITSAAVVTTLARTAGTSGSADSTGTAAQFSGPSGGAVDNAGNVYVADTDNHTIRRITTTAVVTTLAGTARMRGYADNTGAAARFNVPTGVAVDSADNVYVTDTNNHTIRKVTLTGATTTIAGTATGDNPPWGNTSLCVSEKSRDCW